jgi:hypothetical protein
MLLYNITFGIDQAIEQEWIAWIKDNHIPYVMATGLFVEWKMYKVLHDQEDGTISYSIQYFAKNIADVTRYLEIFAPALVEQHRQKFINRHVAFQTLLEEV